MKRVVVSSFVIAALLIGCAGRQPLVEPSERLGITRVVLFQNGLAHIKREGSVENRLVRLETRRDQVDDVLKSLTVVDRGGGQVSSVRVLAEGWSPETSTLEVGLSQAERHDLSISYVAEMSGWRPSYRLVAQEGGGVRVQGMAVVDNLTGEPWTDIELALSTDLPLSFRYELSAPRRPERPQLTNTGQLVKTISPAAVAAAPTSEIQAAYAEHNIIGRVEMSNRAGERVVRDVRPDDARARPDGDSAQPGVTKAVDPLRAIEESSGVGSTVISSPSGFSLGDGESGLVPFLDHETEGELVLLYKPATTAGMSHTHPYQAVLFRNPLEAPLLTGPVAVYSDERFLGDGVTGVIPAEAHAFVAFAMSPSVRVESTTQRGEEDVRGVSVTGGVLTVRLQDLVQHRFVLNSSREWDERIFLFVPTLSGYRPRELPEETIVTEAGYFIPAPAGHRSATVTFELARERVNRIDISGDPRHSYVPALLDLLASSADADVSRLREIVDRLEELDHNERRWQDDLRVRREALREQRSALEALRDVPANASLRRRLGASVAEGVAHVDELTRQAVAANAERVALRQEWYAQLRLVEVEPR